MAELLVASGSRRISALTLVSGISGSTAMPIVMGGNTVQVSHTNFLATTLLNQSNTFSGNNTFGGQTTLLNGLVNGNLVVKGDLTANQYIISSSISHITTSFSSGSTKFGDSADDTHEFTGSVSIDGNLNVPSFTGSLSFTNLTDLPTLISGSSQVSFDGIVDKPTLVSGSSQVSYPDLSNIPNGIISSSAQIDALFNIDGLVSGSSQISFNGITDKPTLVSSSQQIRNYGIFATTGSNTFAGNQIVTGSLVVSGSGVLIGTQTITGSLIVSGSSTFTNIGLAKFTGSVGVSGSVNADSFTLDATSTSNIPALNSTFNLDISGSGEYGGDNFIKKALVLGDGKVLIAGRFQSIDGHITNDIARLNSNGTIDTSFTSPIFGYTFGGDYYGYLNTFVTQSDNKILVGGTFDQVDGNAREGIARLNANGSLDVSFAAQSWSSFAEVKDIAIQNDGKIVCVGYFTSGSRRINTDGTLDTSFNVSTGSSNPSFFNNDYFYSVGLLNSGSEQAILIGGEFQQWGSFSDYNYLVKLNPDGRLDFGFAGTNLDIATIFEDRIQKIKVGDDGYVYVAGRFRDTGIGNNAGFARITTLDEGNGVGAIDTGFRTYITNSFVNDFDFYNGDKILLGGSFTLFGNPSFSVTSANRFVIIDQNDGGLVSNWSSDGLATKYNLNTGSINSVTLLPNDNVLVGGTFTSASFPSTAREGLASLKLAGLGVVTTTTDYSITADTTQLLISSSNTYFSGDVNISGSVTAATFVGDGSGLTGVTAGGVDFDDIANKPTLVSGSSQISYPNLSNIPSGIISSSAQIDLLFDVDGLVSSSQQIRNYGIFATTGSNTFVGNQTITGSLTVSGSSTFTNIGLAKFTGSVNVSGSVTADVFQLGTPTTYLENTAYWLYGNFNNAGAISFGFSSGNAIADIDNVYINETSSDINGAAIVNSIPWINGLEIGSVITIQGIDSSPSNLTQTIVLSVNSITDFSGAWGIGVSVLSSTPVAAAVNGSLYSLSYSTAIGELYTISANSSRLLVSSSNTLFAGDVNISGNVTASVFTGSFVGDGSGLTGLPVATSIDTGSFATTGSNVFVGNQTVTGSLRISGSVIQVGDTDGNIIIESGSISLGESSAFGGNSIAVGKAFIDESAPFSIAVGFRNRTNYDSTAVFGAYNTSSNAGQTIVGVASKLNNSIGQGAFVIGNGTDENNRSNLLVADGNIVQITGSLLLTGSVDVRGGVTASSFSGSFVGDGSGLTGVPGTTPIETGSFATTGSNTFIGNQIVTGSVTISGSISQDGLGVQNIVISNTPITTLTTATGLTAIGYGAGEDITTGYDNTFIGNQAGGNNDTGYINTFVGAQAGALNTTGIFNTFVGRAAGQFNTTGEKNTYIGTLAGQVSTGNYNTFLGSNAGALNTSAGNNTFIGTEAGSDNTLGTQNTFVGRLAGENNSVGNNNTILGASAGNGIQSGSSNTFVGRLAGAYIADGITALSGSNNSVFLGTETKANANSETNQIVIGHQTIGNGSNTVTLGNNSITDTYLKGTVHMENGYSILTQVSQSLEFSDDAAAAAGGVPLGGLYRSGNFILIRLV